MIRPYTKLKVADNTGVKTIQVIRVLRGPRWPTEPSVT